MCHEPAGAGDYGSKEWGILLSYGEHWLLGTPGRSWGLDRVAWFRRGRENKTKLSWNIVCTCCLLWFDQPMSLFIVLFSTIWPTMMVVVFIGGGWCNMDMMPFFFTSLVMIRRQPSHHLQRWTTRGTILRQCRVACTALKPIEATIGTGSQSYLCPMVLVGELVQDVLASGLKDRLLFTVWPSDRICFDSQHVFWEQIKMQEF